MQGSETFIRIEGSDNSEALVNLAHVAAIEEDSDHEGGPRLHVYLADDTKTARYTILGSNLEGFYENSRNFCSFPPPMD